MLVSPRTLALLILLAPSAWGLGLVDCRMKKDDTQYGLIVLSSMIAPPSPVWGTPNRITYKFKKVNGSSLSHEIIPTSSVGMLKELTGDFEGTFGRLHVMKLKAGDYEIDSWEYSDRQNYSWKIDDPPKIPFRVTAGHVIYVGSIEPRLLPAGRRLGHDSVAVMPILIDRRERDIAMLAKMCTAIDPQQVEVSLLDLSPWQ